MSDRDTLRASAAQFAKDSIEPFAGDWDRDGTMPRSVITAMGEQGFLAGPLPASVGGGGHDNAAFIAVYEEIGRACSSTRGFLAVHTGLVSQTLGDFATEEQQARWLPRLGTGEWVGCYALTEEEAGSDAASLTTEAVQDGESWTLNGSKTWITNGGIADLALVFARTGPGERHQGITAFVAELPCDGWQAQPLGVEPLGHRAANHAQINLEGLQIPDANRLGEVGSGFPIAMSALNHGRLGVAAGAVGISRACLEIATDHARSRRQFGKRIGDFQMVQADLADIAAETEAAAALVEKAAQAADSGSDQKTLLTSSAKLFATEAAQRAASKAVLLLGSRGYGSGTPVERHYRDIQGLRIYEGTNHIQRLIIAKDLLGPDEG